MAKPKRKAKTNAERDTRVKAVRAALEQPRDIDQLWGIDQAIGWGERVTIADAERAAIARELVDGKPGAGRAWLRMLAGAGTPDDERAIVELCMGATAGRAMLTRILGTIEARVDDASLARAVAQLEVASPFAEVVVGRGRVAARTTGNFALADALDERAAFVARNAALLADLATTAKEKQRVAATAALAKLTGRERELAAHWVLTECKVDDARHWARLVAVVCPAIPILIAADGLNVWSMSDEKEAELGAAITAAGPLGLDRAAAILEEAVLRIWVHTLEHLAPACPAAFATERGFAAAMRGLAAASHVADRLCEDGRHWLTALTPQQAPLVAGQLIDLCTVSGDSGHPLHHSVGRAMFYFRNPAGLATFAAALDRDITDRVRDEVYDAIYQIPTREAEDVLIAQLWREERCTRDLVFSLNEACMPHRHADVLARLDAQPSFHAAWIYLACQLHWGHRPRFAADVVERVLAWPASGDPARRANVFSQGVVAALELRRYDLARRCLDLLGDTRECVDPTERKASTVLADKPVKDQLAALRSGKLEAQQQKQAAEVAKLRAARTPRTIDDDQLGMLAGGNVGARIVTDPSTHEVWWFDKEATSQFYDGYGIVPAPFGLTIMTLDKGWEVELQGLAAFCAGWRTEARSLHIGDSPRELLLCGERIAFVSSDQPRAWTVLGMRFVDAAAARRWFDVMHAHPAKGNRAVDPFYIAGKRGGTWVRQYGNNTTFAYVVGAELATGGGSKWQVTQRPCGSREQAVAEFATLEADCLRLGLFPRKLELDDRIRPLDDMPLAKWLDDRERDDEQTPGWHLQALPAIRATLEASQLSLDEVDIELGAPATAGELAAYDAALPEPMPAAMRQMWTTAGTAYWRVAGTSSRVLSPAEVIAERATRRAELAKRIATTRGAAKIGWQPDALDVFVVHDEDSWVAYDIRQIDNDTWFSVGGDSLRYHTGAPLEWHLAEGFVSDFVDALKERFPELAKLKYGETVSALAARLAKPKPKPKRKPKAKSKPTKRRR